MKSSISYLKQPDCKSFSLDKPNMKRKGKKNKQNNNKNNNVIIQDKKITKQQQTFNNLIINQKKKRQIKREKSVDLIQQKSREREPSPDFYRETSKITSKRLITNSPFKKSLRKSKNILPVIPPFKSIDLKNQKLYCSKKDFIDYEDIKKKNKLTEYICYHKANNNIKLKQIKDNLKKNFNI